MTDFDNIYWAIQALDRCLSTMKSECNSNSSRAEWIRQNEFTLENAKKSYENFKNGLTNQF